MEAVVMRAWARRAAALHGELRSLAELRDPRWWLLAGGAALPWEPRAAYVVSDAEPSADTFIGHVAPARDPIALAKAARTAIRELEGTLPDQPLAVTVRRLADAAVASPSALDTVAFAIGDACWLGLLDDPALPAALAAVARGETHPALRTTSAATPFVCVTLADDELATARHGHRRAWTSEGGPWLGLGRAGELAVVSTCHMILDGYAHARLAARIGELAARHRDLAPRAASRGLRAAPVPGAVPLEVAWRPLDRRLRALPLAYALGCELHALGRPDARFSPTIQIPVAPGAPDDPERRKRRVVPALVSVRFSDGTPEPLSEFTVRARAALAREASGQGVTSMLLAAARASPAPLAWKRRALGVGRPRWLEPFVDLLGGRGCVSRIELDVASPPACAVSSPARLASVADPAGGCVVTVIDDGTLSAITLSGSGRSGDPAL
ncbi:MAG TPA: hypothetical protein VLT45_26740, partial [Kofleriaceae bacterium]|nr:hypothetical protein [Kofleriaceae bacterium]